MTKLEKQILADLKRLEREEKQQEKQILADLRKLEKQDKKKPGKEYSTQRTRTKIKAFPDKYNKEKFFIANKKRFLLKKPLDIRDNDDIEKAIALLKKMKPLMIAFFKKIHGRKRKMKRVNIGYIITLIFSNIDNSDDVVIDTIAYTTGQMFSKLSSLDQSINNISDDIQTRFEQYLARKGFAQLYLKGFEAEIES